MGPQEHAFRTGVDVLVATPGRLLDHFQQPYAQLDSLEILVLDEADRMLDMGFLPDIRRVLKHLPTRRRRSSSRPRCRRRSSQLTREMLKNPARINIERTAAPAVGITQAIYPVAQDLKSHLLLELLRRDEIKNAIVFTRTKHRANRLAEFLEQATASPAPASTATAARRSAPRRWRDSRTARCGCWSRPTSRPAASTSRRSAHVINFDVPHMPEDYIHRVGRTARAEVTGDAFTFVSPEEENELRDIERAVGKRLPRIIVPDFDYRSGRRNSLRCRSPNGSPPFARGRRRNGRAPRPRRSDVGVTVRPHGQAPAERDRRRPAAARRITAAPGSPVRGERNAFPDQCASGQVGRRLFGRGMAAR